MNEKISLNIKGTGLDITSSIKEYVEKKVVALERFMPADSHGVLEVEVSMPSHHHKHGEIFKTDINLKFKGNSFFTESTKDDMYVTIEDAFDEIIRQVKTTKEKKVAVWRKGARMLKDFLRRG